jgi:hypothetical protein
MIAGYKGSLKNAIDKYCDGSNLRNQDNIIDDDTNEQEKIFKLVVFHFNFLFCK